MAATKKPKAKAKTESEPEIKAAETGLRQQRSRRRLRQHTLALSCLLVTASLKIEVGGSWNVAAWSNPTR